MNWRETALLVIMAICVALVAATVIDAFVEHGSTAGGFGNGADPYSVSIVKPTRTEHPPLPTIVVTEEATGAATHHQGDGRHRTPEPVPTDDSSSTGDF